MVRRTPRYDMDTLDGALVTRVAPPPPREWKPVTSDSTDLTGTRVALSQPTTWWHDLRVICEPFLDGSRWFVRITEEEVWYAAGQDPLAVPPDLQLVVPVTEVWAE